MRHERAPYVAAVNDRLLSLIKRRAKSVAALEKTMGREENYVRQALNGGKRLTLDLIVEVLDALGVDPDDFFAGRSSEPYPREGPTEHVLSEVQTSYGAAHDAEATRHLVDELGATGAFAALVRVLLEKGVLTAADLTQAGDAGKKKV